MGLGPAVHSETLDTVERYLCLTPSARGPAWVRPSGLFHDADESGPRFRRVGLVRTVAPEDEPTVLAFGYDAWGAGRELGAFVASYAHSAHHLRGTRYLLEDDAGAIVADLNTLRFQRGVVGIASVATHPERRREGHASRLLAAVMALVREREQRTEEPTTRFLLFSEVNPALYERLGFRTVEPARQRFAPSVAMATDLERHPLRADEARWLESYF